MTLSTLDIAIICIYAVSIFSLAQWVSREKGTHQKDAQDYFLASRALPWWAIGTSLIAANISAEQIIGMSGSGYVIGLGIASYEWMAALTLLIVGKYFVPIFLKNSIYTMPEFLERRFSTTVRTVMAIFWLGVYVFVNLVAILWLGATAVSTVTGLEVQTALIALGVFAGLYALYGGLKAVALTDIVQVSLLVLGGLIISYIALNKVSGGAGVVAGFQLADDELPGPLPHDPSGQQPELQGPAGPVGAARRHVGHERVVLGLQSVHHPARARRQGHPRGAEGHRACRVPETADAGDHRAARHCRRGAGAESAEARPGLSSPDGDAAARASSAWCSRR